MVRPRGRNHRARDAQLVADVLASRPTGHEQSLRPPQQRRQEQRQRQTIGEQRRDIAGCELLGDAEEQAAGNRPRQRAHAAQRHRNEPGIGEKTAAVELQRHDRRHRGAADRADHGSKGEAEQRETRHIDAHETRGRRIFRAGDHRLAQRSTRHEVPDTENDRQGDPRDPQALRWHQNAQDIDRLFPGESRHGIGLAAPHHQRQPVDEGEQTRGKHQHAAGGQPRQRGHEGHRAERGA